MRESSVELVGRETEIDRLQALLERAGEGAGTAVILEGEPGIGKTRLVEEIIAEGRTRGFTVLRGGADEIERDRPFGAFVDALDLRRARDDARSAIARLLADAGRAVGDQSYRLVEAMAAFVEEATARAPLLLALEDLHWADLSTLRVVRALGRTAPQLPLLLMLTFRLSPRLPEADRVIDALRGSGGVHIQIGPLGEVAVEELAARAASAPPGIRLRRLVAGAAGNPLFILELIRALEEEGSIRVEDGTAEIDSNDLPPSLRLTILRRLSFLPPDTFDALKLAAILGSSFSIADVAMLRRKPAVDVAADLQESIRVGLLVESGERLRFRHDLIRESIEADMPIPVRRVMHRSAADALAEAGAPAARVADHMSLGAEPGDREAVRWLRRAAGEAAPHAPAIAVTLLSRALELLEPHDPARPEIVAQILEPLVWTGQAERAEALARDVLGHGLDPATEVTIRSGLAGAVGYKGDLWRSIEEMERGAALNGAPPEDRLRLTSGAAYLRAMLGDLAGAREHAQKVLAARPHDGSPFTEAQAHQALAVVAAAEGRVDDAISLAREMEDAAERSARVEGGRAPYLLRLFWLGIALLDADRFPEAADAFERGRRLAEESGAVANLPVFDWALALHRLFAGEWDDAVTHAEAGLELADDVETRAGAMVGHAVRAIVAFHRDELDGAETAVADAQREVAQHVGLDLTAWVDAMLREARGDPATTVLDAIWDAFRPVRYLLTYRTIASDVVRFALVRGDRDRARAVIEELEEGARRSRVPSAEGVTLRCRAMLEGDAALAMKAVEAYRRGPRVLDRALACEDAAALAASTADATPLLDEALAIYDALAARRGVARVESALRVRGVRRRRPTPRTRATVGWEALTKTELEVVRLAAQGLTNRQIGERLFVSRRTVETHLGHVFQKLGLSTRVELAAEAVRRLG